MIPTNYSNKNFNNEINKKFLNADKLNENFTTAALNEINNTISNDINDEYLNIDLFTDKQFSLLTVHNEKVEERIKKLSSKKSNVINSLCVRFLHLIITFIWSNALYL